MHLIRHNTAISLAVAVLVLLISVLLVLIRNASKTDTAQIHPEISSAKSIDKADSEQFLTDNSVSESGIQPIDPALLDSLLPDLEDFPGNPTITDLLKKGYPTSPKYRQLLIQHTAEQSVDQTISDLGNVVTSGLSRIQVTGEAGDRSAIKFWQSMTHHIKLLRVIEEGRRSPDKIADSLWAEYAEAVDGFSEMRRNGIMLAIAQSRNPNNTASLDFSMNDPYYEEHKKYENPFMESERRFEMIYQSLYALESIGCLDRPDLIAQLFEQDIRQAERPTELHVWFIDRYYQRSGVRHSKAAQQYLNLVGGKFLSEGETVTQSTWDAPWDIHNPMLGLREVDISGIETIDVPDIPDNIPLPDNLKQQVIADFIQHAKQ